MSTATDLFDYALPAHLIAQKPAERRDQSRLLVIDRTRHKIQHRTFADLPGLLRSGDLLFRNNAAVLPARLRAYRPTGGEVECLLLSSTAQKNEWWCLLRPGKKLPVGSRFGRDGAFSATVKSKQEDGTALIEFAPQAAETIAEIAQQLGDVPLPPYIERKGTEAERRQDLDRYQTVYADRARTVAAAAPTAGLHFTPEVLNGLARAGIGSVDITLHVGLGTFKPLNTPTLEQHAMHREKYELPAKTQAALFATTGRRVAVGTTAVRSIEDFLVHYPSAPTGRDFVAETAIFIYPPWQFRGVDALITNFHQPRSTLLCLVAAFLTPGRSEGIIWLKEIYQEAIARDYRFFSYGDAMLIL